MQRLTIPELDTLIGRDKFQFKLLKEYPSNDKFTNILVDLTIYAHDTQYDITIIKPTNHQWVTVNPVPDVLYSGKLVINTHSISKSLMLIPLGIHEPDTIAELEPESQHMDNIPIVTYMQLPNGTHDALITIGHSYMKVSIDGITYKTTKSRKFSTFTSKLCNITIKHNKIKGTIKLNKIIRDLTPAEIASMFLNVYQTEDKSVDMSTPFDEPTIKPTKVTINGVVIGAYYTSPTTAEGEVISVDLTGLAPVVWIQTDTKQHCLTVDDFLEAFTILIPNWYENIPECGVLCKHKLAGVILIKYTNNALCTEQANLIDPEDIIPLTQDEALALVLTDAV